MTPAPSSTITALGLSAVAVLTMGSTTPGTDPTEPTSGSETSVATDEFVLPTGYTMLVDDTDRLTVAVPDTWDVVNTVPGAVEGTVVPRIAAGTDVEAGDATFAESGVLYSAYPFVTDVETLYQDHFEPAGCASDEVVPYDDGAFVGQWWRHTECGPAGEGEFHVVVASPASDVATVAVVIQLDAHDEALLDAVLQSFNFTPTASWPTPAITTTTSTSTSTSTTTTAAPEAPASSLTPETRNLVNNSGLLVADMPMSWSEFDTIGSLNDDGSYRPTLLAAPGLSDFNNGFDAPGARVSALPPGTDVATTLANTAKPDDCVTAGPAPFDNGELHGLSESWAGCAEGTTDVMFVVATPPDGDFVVHARLQDEAGGGSAALIADSLAVVNDATYPTTTVPEAPIAATGTVPASLSQRPSGVQSILVVEQTRNLRIDVPAAWRDTRLFPSLNDDGSPRPRVVAALHVETMLAQWDAPGMIFNESPYTDPATWLANRATGLSGCVDGGAQAYDDGEYHGLLHTRTNCGGTQARFVTLVVSPLDNSSTLTMEVQLPTADDTNLSILLSSFGQL